MERHRTKYFKGVMPWGIFLIGLSLLLHFIDGLWLNIIFKIEKAIKVRDSGHLILAAANMGFLYALQNTFLFLGAVLVIYCSDIKLKLKKTREDILCALLFIFINIGNALIFNIPWEPAITILSLIIVMLIFKKLYRGRNSFIHISIVAIQVFYAFQWLNIMPMFSSYWIGNSDLPYSIKISGIYLNSTSVLNFTGFAFFLPLIFSAFATTIFFISNTNYLNIMRLNYEKERQLQNINGKILKNMVSNEIKSLVHDLKTPLVTIRGLNSLLSVTLDHGKVIEYSERIESSTDKMNEMISSFLYDASRQKLRAEDLINYIRAQLPLEDETIIIRINIFENLPHIYVNKIRVARAVINILENAIVVPCNKTNKQICLKALPACGGLHIVIQDNGIGIRESEIHRIFEVGYSTNNTSGLGLPFARQIIEDNGGTIQILSEEGRGTKVTIFLPQIEDSLNENL